MCPKFHGCCNAEQREHFQPSHCRNNNALDETRQDNNKALEETRRDKNKALEETRRDNIQVAENGMLRNHQLAEAQRDQDIIDTCDAENRIKK